MLKNSISVKRENVNNIYNSIYLIIGISIFTYVLVRSIFINVTFDEAWTLRVFVPEKIFNIFSYNPCDANHHLLNTLLIKGLFAILPETLFVARLPNLIASIVFIYYAYRISSQFLNPKLGWICFALLLFNPFLIDYFSQARGYGLALGFQLASIYYLFCFSEDFKIVNIVRMLVFSTLAVLSVFIFINFYIACSCIVFLIILLNFKKIEYKKIILLYFVGVILLAAIIFIPIQKLIINKSLYYGGNINFYEDSLMSLTQFSLYLHNSSPVVEIVLNIFLLLLISSVIYSFFFKNKILSVKNIIIAILFLCVIAVIFQFYFLKTLYIIDRGMLYFYPFLIVTLCLSIQSFSHKKISNVIYLILIIFAFNFGRNFNFHKTVMNYFEAHTLRILEDINQEGMKNNTIYKIDFSWPFGSSIDYYTTHNKFNNIELVKNYYDRNSVNPIFDYYIFLSDPIEKACYWGDLSKILNQKGIITKTMEYKKEDIIVYKKTEPYDLNIK